MQFAQQKTPIIFYNTGLHPFTDCLISNLTKRQLVSSALALTVSGHLDDAEHLKIAGPGLRDMTRLAESSYGIWKDILSTNGDNLQRALDQFIGRLKHFGDHMGTPELQRDFDAAQKIREKLFPS
jgi:prephenate dehydrogenase